VAKKLIVLGLALFLISVGLSRPLVQERSHPVRYSSLPSPHYLDSNSHERNFIRAHPSAARYQEIVDKYVRKGLPGLALLVRTPEEGIWIGTGGYTRLEDRTPIRPDTPFHTLGLCQLFTTTAMMMLKDEGALNLDAPIDRYLPWEVCDRIANGHSATVRHLLGFVSGIPDFEWTLSDQNDPLKRDWRDLLESVYDRPALFSAGRGWKFGNINFLLGAMIIDELTGSHAEFFNRRIFQPLGLRNTYYRIEPGLPSPPRVADVYYDRYGDGDLENRGEVFRQSVYNRTYGFTNIIMTLPDLARFVDALFGGELVSPASLAEMTTASFPDLYPNYGLGMKIYDQFADPQAFGKAYWNGGWGQMGLADMFHFPDAGVTILYASNYANNNRTDIIDDFSIIADVARVVFASPAETVRDLSESAMLPGGETATRREVQASVRHHPFQAVYQAVVDKYVKKGLPGLAMLIRTPEEGPWIGTGGYTRLEDRTPIRPGTLFYSCSHLKPYTATAIMMLKEEGRIDLDAVIDRYLPADVCDKIANGHSATVRQLLSHRSGIPTYEMVVPPWNDPYSKTWRDELESVYGKPAEFPPGTNYSYSNTNFMLLAMIIDEVAGYHAEFLDQRIFQPLGLGRSYYKIHQGLPSPPGVVDIYFDRYLDGSLENAGEAARIVAFNTAYGAGGMIADMTDYARFIEALLGGELISPESLEEMMTPTSPEGYPYGLGLIWHDMKEKGMAYGHGGRGLWGLMEMSHFPASGITIGYATNYGYHGGAPPPSEAFDTIWEDVVSVVFNRYRGSIDSGRQKRAGPRDRIIIR
jgi:D-alanyl-D-alanine carboxypeptidase